MTIDDFKTLMDEFDPASLLPELDTLVGKIALVARIAVLVGPLLLVVMGLLYLFAAPKEANYHFGYRCYYGMGSVSAWRFTQRIAGLVFSALGLILGIVMLVISGSFSRLETVDLLWRAIYCAAWEAGLVAIACIGINVTAMLCFNGKGDRRKK